MVKATVFKYVKDFDHIPKPDSFQMEEFELPPLKTGEVLFQALYLSVDPYQKVFMPEYGLGKVMIGEQVSRIIESKNPKYPVGTEYMIACGWRTHIIFNPDKIGEVDWKPFHQPNYFRPVHPGLKGLPLSLALGTVGMPGATAYVGMTKKLNVEAGKTILINAATGAVGQVAGQIAKIMGLKAIGTAGSKSKCDFLKQLGFDVAINYKTEKIGEALKREAPDGVDYYLDLVAGNFSSTVIGKHMKVGGKVVIIGHMAEHTESTTEAVEWSTYILQDLTVQGFVIYRLPDEVWNDAFDHITTWIKQGKLTYKEAVTEGFANAPKAFGSLFVGENFGKAVVKLNSGNESLKL